MCVKIPKFFFYVVPLFSSWLLFSSSALIPNKSNKISALHLFSSSQQECQPCSGTDQKTLSDLSVRLLSFSCNTSHHEYLHLYIMSLAHLACLCENTRLLSLRGTVQNVFQLILQKDRKQQSDKGESCITLKKVGEVYFYCTIQTQKQDKVLHIRRKKCSSKHGEGKIKKHLNQTVLSHLLYENRM